METLTQEIFGDITVVSPVTSYGLIIALASSTVNSAICGRSATSRSAACCITS